MLGSYSGERTYKVKIEDVLAHLKKNREEHAAIVEEAQAKFRELAIEKLDAMLKEAREGRKIKTSVGLTVPTSHTDAFDNAIGLLEMTQGAGETTIEIDASEYERFVRNRWEWSEKFRASNSGYTQRV